MRENAARKTPLITVESFDQHKLGNLLLADSGIAFVLDNPAIDKGGAVIYITSDPALSKFNLTIKNNSGSPIEIGPESLIQIYATTPFDWDDLKRTQLLTAGWELKPGDDCLELRPTKTATLAAETVTISFGNVRSTGEAGTAFFKFDYSGIKNLRDGGKSVQVFIHHPPQGKPAPFRFGIPYRPEYADEPQRGDRDNRLIYRTPWPITTSAPGINNYFVVDITYGGENAITKKAGVDSRFTFSFVSGTSDLSLCTNEQLKVVEGSRGQGGWDVEKDKDLPTPVWKMRPPANTIFDPGGLISFRFQNIITQLAPGLSSPLYIQWVNLPGYNDGYVALVLRKDDAVPYVRYFDAYKGSQKIPFDSVVGYKEKITLKWDVFAAEASSLLNSSEVFPPVHSVEVQPAEAINTYTLVPRIGGDARSSWCLDRRFRVPPPAVERFAGSPDTIAGGAQTSVIWKCSNGSHCNVSGPGAPAGLLPLDSSFNVTLQQDANYSITCFGVGSVAAQTAIRVPPVEVTISARIVGAPGKPGRYCTVSWSASWAVSCEVSGSVSSKELQGSKQISIRDDSWIAPGFRFRITAKGRGEVTKEIAVSDQKPQDRA